MDESLMTEEFLSVLVVAAKEYGPMGDVVEIDNFVRACFEVSGREPPEIDYYEFEIGSDE